MKIFKESIGASDRRHAFFYLGVSMIVSITMLHTGCKTTTERLNLDPLQTVEQVKLEAYLGHWYEIARLPAWFQKDCVGSTATYSLRKDGQIDVVNRCFKDTLNGPMKEARGLARIVDTKTNSKLEVSFFQPFWGEYWIIKLDNNYRYAVVGHPSRDYLWILSREPTMNEENYRSVLLYLKDVGYDIEKLIKTPQVMEKKKF